MEMRYQPEKASSDQRKGKPQHTQARAPHRSICVRLTFLWVEDLS
jgi:hypothetical protein